MILSEGCVQEKEGFWKLPKFLKGKVWVEAQRVQQYIENCGINTFAFRYSEKDYKNVTETLLENHINAFSPKSFSEFLDKRLFWIYN